MLIRSVFVVCLGWLATDQALAISVDELVAKNVEARGGMQALQAIASLRMEGKLIAGGGFEIGTVLIYKRPSSYRFEGTVQGLTLVQSYDGKQGWRISPFQGRKDPELMAADDLKELAEEADFDGAWVNAAAKGNKLEVLGIEDVDGTQAHKMKVSLRNGDTEYVYFDPDQFLVIRAVQQRTVRGVEIQQETEYSDYEKINGVYFAFSVASGGVGDTQKNKRIVDKGAANIETDELLFAFPSAGAAK